MRLSPAGHSHYSLCLLLPLLAAGLLSPGASGAEKIAPDDLAFFESKIRPLLAKHCYECHSEKAKKVKGGLLLDSVDGIAKGGDSGEVIEPGDPSGSLLLKSVRSTDPEKQMPPKKKLAEAEVAALETWIRIGAPDPRKGGNVAQTKPNWTMEEGRKHWAYQPVAKPQPPSVKNKAWVKNDTDRFVLAKIEAKNLKPAPDADRPTLIRRATYDLTGLPPTVEEMQAFVKDGASDDVAFAKVVDRLLKSPRFGERWGRHWLDVVRYADSVGRTRNIAFPFAWRYRDYVIDAFNADKPFNQFLTEQLAGDLLPAANDKQRDAQVLGTGFLALGSMDLNERDGEQFFLDRVDDQLDTVGRAFMGLTTGCARCHDHKFDPIPQSDYYAVAGIFGSTQTLSGQKNRGGGGGKDYFAPSLLVKLGAANADAPAASAVPIPAASNAEREELEKKLAGLKKELNDLQKSDAKKSPQSKKERNQLTAQIANVSKRIRALNGPDGAPAGGKKGGKKAEEVKLSPTDMMAMGAREGKVQDLQLRVRGEPDQHGDTIPRGFLQVLQWNQPPALPKDVSGRLQLAAWLTDAQHPLTARVAVNRIWKHLFGRGIVPTVDNFGVTGEAPTHPELLDHLTANFTANGWSVKAMIRSLMLSHAYRISSKEIPANMEADSNNNLFWRMNLRRLEVESIRDAMLAVSGTLNVERPADTSFVGDPTKEIGKGGKGGGKGDAFATPVRSVYLPVIRSGLPGMFTTFDFAEPSTVIGQRDVTTVPPQALFFLNNEFVVQLARQTSERIAAMPLATDEAKVQHVYRLLFGREATSDETKRAVDYLAMQTPASPGGGKNNAPLTGWTTFVQALMGSAEFRYVL